MKKEESVYISCASASASANVRELRSIGLRDVVAADKPDLVFLRDA